MKHTSTTFTPCMFRYGYKYWTIYMMRKVAFYRLSDETGKIVLTPVQKGPLLRRNLDERDGGYPFWVIAITAWLSHISVFGGHWNPCVCMDWKSNQCWRKEKGNDICSCKGVMVCFFWSRWHCQFSTELLEGHWPPSCSCLMYQIWMWYRGLQDCRKIERIVECKEKRIYR